MLLATRDGSGKRRHSLAALLVALLTGIGVGVILERAHVRNQNSTKTATRAKPLAIGKAELEAAAAVEGQPDPEVQQAFEAVYSGKAWGEYGNGSGLGSELNYTVTTRTVLKQLVEDLDVHSMVDCPCGAMAWMPTLLEELEVSRPGFRYSGFDVARQVIEQNKAAFVGKKQWRFDVLDMSTQAVPAKDFDLALTRDALQHLSCERVVASLRNLAFSGVAHLLVGSYDSPTNVPGSTVGGMAAINLKVPPYSLLPDKMLDEQTPDGKLLYLYRASELQKQDFDAMTALCDGPQ